MKRARPWVMALRVAVVFLTTATTAIICSFVLGGCSSNIQATARTDHGPGHGPRSRQGAHPPGQYMTAEASSHISFDDAEQRARSALAAQIRSSLEAQITSTVRSSQREGIESYSSDTDQRIQQDVVFSRAELIRIDPQSRRHHGDLYHARAYLSRGEAEQALSRDFEAAVSAHKRSGEAALAVPSGDMVELAAAFSSARRNWDTLLQHALELRAITGRYPEGFTEAEAFWETLLARRAQQLEGFRLSLTLLPAAMPDDRIDTAYLHQQFTRALTDLGLAVRGDTCGEGNFLIKLEPRVDYRGMVGVVCRLTFAGHLIECATGDTWDLHIAHTDFSGDGSNTMQARNRAVSRVTAARLGPLLMDALGGALPVH